ncbi:probable cystatin-16 [Camelus ferus]|uniref:Probable cystatin-16 n=1 Tax=Camelus ferus TaxID=419612 RepID=A0A8B8RGG9_CAMFR|nr:probable cystatin-16 [Camelus ferus]
MGSRVPRSWPAGGAHRPSSPLTPDSMFPKASLLLGLTVPGSHLWTFQKAFADVSKNHGYFTMSVELAVASFSSGSKDMQAHRLLEVGRAQQESWTVIFLMDLELGQTICRKRAEDLGHCPLQEGPGEKKVSCTFVVDSQPWITQFTLVNSTCQQNQGKGPPSPAADPLPLDDVPGS